MTVAPPLVSIILPTKNRQFTCLYAIESALRVDKDDIEIIVEDCSDTAVLEQQIIQKFGDDPRIKYRHVSTTPSMTENWNNAFGRSTGTYMCIIGDDDGILSNIYQAASWGRENKIMCITHSNAFTYNWPDYASKNLRGVAIELKKNTEGFAKIPYDEKKFRKYCSLESPMGYALYPMAYHNLTHRQLYDQVIKDNGKFVSATSPDVYSAFCYHKYLKHSEFGYANFQFTIRGASGASNSSRFTTGKISEHFSEFKDRSWPHQYLPFVQSLHSTVAESMINACLLTGQKELIAEINFPLLYARCTITDPSAKEAILSTYLTTEKSKAAYNVYLHGLKKFSAAKLMSAIAMALPIPRGLKHTLFSLRYGQVIHDRIDNIIDGIKMIENKKA